MELRLHSCGVDPVIPPYARQSQPDVDIALLSRPTWHLIEYVVHAVRAAYTTCIGANPLRGATVVGEAHGEVQCWGSVGLTMYSKLVLSFSACLGTPKRVLIAPGVQLDGQLQRLCERARIHEGVCMIVTLSRQVLMA